MVPAEEGHDATREIEEPIISAGKILDVLVGSPDVSGLSEAKDLGRFGGDTVHKKGVELFDDWTNTGLEIIRFGEGTVHKKGVELFDDCTKTGTEIKRFGEDTVHKKGVEVFDDCTKTGTEIERFGEDSVHKKKCFNALPDFNSFLACVQEKTKLFPVTSTADEDSELYLDSGCSWNVVYAPALLSNCRDPPAGMDHFVAADGSRMAIVGYGDIVKGRFKIPGVYLVDGLKVNLISVGQIGSCHKVWSCFAGDECKLTRNGVEVGQAVRRGDNLYILTSLEI